MKTYKDDIIEKFPHLTEDDLRSGKVCRDLLYKTICKFDCTECWNEEMEDKE